MGSLLRSTSFTLHTGKKSKLIKPTDYRSFKYNSTNELGVMTTSCVSCVHVLLLKHVQIHTAAAVSMLRFSTITHNAVIRTKRGGKLVLSQQSNQAVLLRVCLKDIHCWWTRGLLQLWPHTDGKVPLYSVTPVLPSTRAFSWSAHIVKFWADTHV